MKLLRPEIELTIGDLNALIVVLDSAIRDEDFAEPDAVELLKPIREKLEKQAVKQRDAFIEKNKPKEQRPMPKEENIYIGKIPEYGFQKEIKLYADENGFLKIK